MEERHRIRLRDDLSLNRVWLLLKTLMASEFQELTSKELRTVESKAWYESFFSYSISYVTSLETLNNFSTLLYPFWLQALDSPKR